MRFVRFDRRQSVWMIRSIKVDLRPYAVTLLVFLGVILMRDISLRDFEWVLIDKHRIISSALLTSLSRKNGVERAAGFPANVCEGVQEHIKRMWRL
jgi:hypothetical protein